MQQPKAQWRERVLKYYAHYNPLKATLHHVDDVVELILRDPEVWKALLAKYGPELDPPFDKPYPTIPELQAQRNFVHKRFQSKKEMTDFWFQRLLLYWKKYAPEKSEAEIREFVSQVQPQHWSLVWQSLLAKYGPEPRGDNLVAGAQLDAPLPTEVDVEIDGVKYSADLTTRQSAFDIRKKQLERGERELAKIRIARHFSAHNKPMTYKQISDMVDSCCSKDDVDKLVDRVRNEQDAPEQLLANQQLSREYWRELLCAFEPQLTMFAVEDVIDAYAAGAEGMNALFTTISSKLQTGFYHSACRKPSYALVLDLPKREFWLRRLREYFQRKKVERTDAQIELLLDFGAVTDWHKMWWGVLDEFGPEDSDIESKWKRHKEYWVSKSCALLKVTAPRVREEEVEGLFDHCNRQWERQYANIERYFGNEFQADKPLELAKEPAQKDEPLINTEITSREQWKRRFTQYLSVCCPSRAFPDHVEQILVKAEKAQIPFETTWRLLIAKYGSKKQPSSENKEDTGCVKAHETANELKLSDLAFDRQHWKSKVVEYCRAMNVPVSELEIDVALDKYSTHKDGFVAMWNDLQVQYGHWSPPEMDSKFWQWAVLQFSPPDSVVLQAKTKVISWMQAFKRLVDSHHGGAQDVSLKDLFHQYEAAAKNQSSRRLNLLSQPPIANKEFWLEKMERYRRAHCPSLSEASVTAIMETTEVAGTAFEDMWIQFVRLCHSSQPRTSSVKLK